MVYAKNPKKKRRNNRLFYHIFIIGDISIGEVGPTPLAMPMVEHKVNGQVDSASATAAVDSGLIPGEDKPKTIKIGIHGFRA